MGLAYPMLTLSNPRLPNLPPLTLPALADTGSVHLCLPESVRETLQLEVLEHRPVVTADGSVHQVPYAGPVRMGFKNRNGYTGALVMGGQVLLGAIPMEDMDLVVIPRTREVDVNPAHPDAAYSMAVGEGNG